MSDNDQASHNGSRLNGITLLLVLAVGFISASVNPSLLNSTAGNLVAGEWSSTYQTAFNETLPLLPPARAFWNALDLVLFGQAPAGVLSSSGWLFTDEEYSLAADPAAVLQARLQELSAVKTELDHHGVQLLVAVVPAKAAVLTEYAPPLPPAAVSRYAQALAGLNQAGIPAVDLRPALASEAAWLRTDTHWSPAGADAAAQLISAAARGLQPGLGNSVRYESTSLPPERFEGDLYRLLALGPFSGLVGPQPDTITPLLVQQAAGNGSGLLADRPPELVLVGTSYSAASEWNLADRLRLLLAADVLDLATSGRGHLAPMREYLESGALAASPPRLVVWEVPERYLNSSEFLTDQQGAP